MSIIEDGRGSGKRTGVDSDNRLLTRAFSESIQHTTSHVYGDAYQITGVANLSPGTTPILHIKNNSSTKDLVVTYVRHQVLDVAGGTAFPNADNYYRIALGRTYVSGGSELTAINVNTGSGMLADVTIYNASSVLTGTAEEIDRWYTKAEGDMNAFNKEGSVILEKNGTLELSYIGDQTSGVVYSRISFLMMTPN